MTIFHNFWFRIYLKLTTQKRRIACSIEWRGQTPQCPSPRCVNCLEHTDCTFSLLISGSEHTVWKMLRSSGVNWKSLQKKIKRCAMLLRDFGNSFCHEAGRVCSFHPSRTATMSIPPFFWHFVHSVYRIKSILHFCNYFWTHLNLSTNVILKLCVQILWFYFAAKILSEKKTI